MNILERANEFEIRDDAGRRVAGYPTRPEAEAFVAGAAWCWTVATARTINLVTADLKDVADRLAKSLGP